MSSRTSVFATAASVLTGLPHQRCVDCSGVSERHVEHLLHVAGAGTLLKDLGTLAYNVTHAQPNPEVKIVLTTRPTPLQAKAFALLALNPACTQ